MSTSEQVHPEADQPQHVEESQQLSGDAPAFNPPAQNKLRSTYARGNELGQLPLQHCWDLFHVDPEQVANNRWEPHFIASFQTVRDFWCIFNNIAQPTYLPFNTFLYMFKHGISPQWESPENAHGGELAFTMALHHESSNPDEFDAMWINTLLAIIGEYFSKSSAINGICCTAKTKFLRISIWLRDAKDAETINIIKKEWVENLEGKLLAQNIFFKPFSK